MDQSLSIGRSVPDFSLPSHKGGNLSLSDFRGQKLLIYFYPKDDTPGCTRQACALNNDLRALNNLSLNVIGVSRDSIDSHKKFAQKFNLKFPLLSDVDGAMCDAYGVWVEKSMYGKTYMGIERSSFLIDENGNLIAMWRKVSPDDHLALVKNQLTGITNSTTPELKPDAHSASVQQTPSGKVTTMATTKKPAAKKTAAKKPAAKKPAAKKATAKKPAAKKATAKKPVAKKATAAKKPAAKKATAAKKPAAKKTTAKKTTAKKPAARKTTAKRKAA